MITLFLVVLSGFQLAAYKWLDLQKKAVWKKTTLLLILIGHCTVFPQFFKLEASSCGMPLLGVYMAFWILGNIITLLVHLSYHLVNRISTKK